ncbi:probable G-protein coupled receptor 160 [Betta splendens]|uniref:Probable G-protein coupled receptor 160 n=1 Tax=Betta splendens TaxID=158456 RepID=A0A6P7N0I7_BETSP|nr:probable G-protein coupled receptor 160 [Betta splendens]XP_029011832.1 probable G-protein coupled receptor 160 [Betta splendens]XP_029011833.1 probable G-protein coupled receptor 160 [Betta splendens]
MLPESVASVESSHFFKMFAIIKEWDEGSGCHTTNTDKYLLLVLFKLGLDIAVFYLCCRRICTSFITMCSLSIILADVGMAISVASLWFLEPERSLVTLCFILANASAIYKALPLPIMCLGLLNYCLENSLHSNQRTVWKFLKNLVLTLLVWMQAFMYTFGSVRSKLIELDYVNGTKALVCAAEESSLINHLILGVFIIVIFSMLPFCSRIPQWIKEADRLCDLREKQENQKSDFFFTSTQWNETKGNEDTNDTIKERPPLWFSLTMGFGIFWMPYLIVTVASVVFGLDVPAYINVNLLWLECMNSVVMGVMFWIKSKKLGPYSNLPENVCMWHIYWHLSKGTQQQPLPISVFNPSKEKQNTILSV